MFYFIFHSSLDFSAGSRNNIPKSKKKLHASGCLFTALLRYAKWKWGLRCVSVDHQVWGGGIWGCQWSGSTSGWQVPGGVRRRWRDPTQGPAEKHNTGTQTQTHTDTHRHTHTHTCWAFQQPFISHHPALPSTCLHLTDFWCAVRGQKNKTKLGERFAAPPSSETPETHRGVTRGFYHADTSRAVFVFCRRGRRTHLMCAVTTVRRDRQIQVAPPHKHILLAAGTWSSFSHDSALTRKRQTTTTAAAHRGRGLLTSPLSWWLNTGNCRIS